MNLNILLKNLEKTIVGKTRYRDSLEKHLH